MLDENDHQTLRCQKNEFSGIHLHLNLDTLFFVFLFVSSIGLFGLIQSFIKVLKHPLTSHVHFNAWAQFFYNHDKPQDFGFYFLLVFLLLPYYLLFFYAYRGNKLQKLMLFWQDLSFQNNLTLWFCFLGITNLALLGLGKNVLFFILGVFAWVGFLLSAQIAPWLQNIIPAPARLSKICWGIVVFIVLELILMFAPFTFTTPKMINPFLDIPEQTLLSSHFVNDQHFIQEHHLFESPVCGKMAPLSAKSNQPLAISNFSPEISKDTLTGCYFPPPHQRQFSPIEIQFLKKNQFELRWQFLNRWIFHHYNHILGPINEISLGKPIQNCYMQYGWVNVLTLKQLMTWFGGISYQNCFRFSFLFYLLYYVAFIAVVFLLLRELPYITLTLLLAMGLLNGIGFTFLFLGPGLNPFRHLFDISILFFFYLYLYKERTIYLYSAFLFSILDILIYPLFGLGGLFSLVVVLVLRQIQEPKKCPRNRFWPVIGATCLGLIAFQLGKIGPDYMTGYFIRGLAAGQLAPLFKFEIFFILSIGYLFYIAFWKAQNPHKYIFIFLLLYCQVLFTYFVWESDINHLLPFMPILALTGVIGLQILLKETKASQQKITILLVALLCCASFVYLSGIRYYWREYHQYSMIFKTHKTYQWHFQRAQFISTVDPQPFEEAVQRIQHYAPQSKIYIISKHDNILPFLAQRYNGLPYFDVPWYLLTSKEINLCIQTLQKARPQYLFVDTDIDNTLRLTDIVSPEVPYIGDMSQESIQRVKRLSLLKTVFDAVRKDYTLIDKGPLLTVYLRKAK